MRCSHAGADGRESARILARYTVFVMAVQLVYLKVAHAFLTARFSVYVMAVRMRSFWL